jgi:uncharacterized protein
MTNHVGSIASKFNIAERFVEATISLLDEGATVPFISRYRKERTGALDEVAVRNIEVELQRLRELDKRREFIVKAIEDAGAMTPDIRKRIDAATDSASLEDIYLPFKPKRRTRAQIAREQGLEPLARMIMSGNCHNIHAAAQRFVGKDKAADCDAAIAGASDIIAEWVSESQGARNKLRNRFNREGEISSSVVKGHETEANNVYRNYIDFCRDIRRCPSHQYLALRRAEREGVLKVDLNIDDAEAIDGIASSFVKGSMDSDTYSVVKSAVTDGYKRLLKPSIENEISASLKERADAEAIRLFADNLRQLLLAPPVRGKNVIAIDPGYRTGCKVAVIDDRSNLVDDYVIYPTPPKSDTDGAAKLLNRLIRQYNIKAIALGNATASRETEDFLRKSGIADNVDLYIVSESGASIYSASDIAREEFPNKDVTVRGAVSIGRRLIDPLAELVKIDPKSIGVGQYQHDVDQTALKASLDFTVMSCVNLVGVNVNTASRQLLSYISGIGPQLAGNIIEYRKENGAFRHRRDLLKVKRMGAKAYEQAAGFLRVPDGDCPLDNTNIHPESYPIVERMAKDLKVTTDKLIGNATLIDSIRPETYTTATVGLETINDIIAELHKPGRDPRCEAEAAIFDPNIKTIEDLQPGMVLDGIVNNITAFGAFVDIGVKESGLVHISQLADHRVASVNDVVSINQKVRVKVIDIDLDRHRISLSMKGVK